MIVSGSKFSLYINPENFTELEGWILMYKVCNIYKLTELKFWFCIDLTASIELQILTDINDEV